MRPKYRCKSCVISSFVFYNLFLAWKNHLHNILCFCDFFSKLEQQLTFALCADVWDEGKAMKVCIYFKRYVSILKERDRMVDKPRVMAVVKKVFH